VARRDGTVIAGNHTLQAARRLGWAEIAVVWVDDDEATAKAFALADNRTAELGGYDDQLLADLITEVREADAALLGATGWTDEAVADLMTSLEPVMVPQALRGDPDDCPDDAPAKSVEGDVWLLGPHRLLCGDSTKPTDLERLMGDDVADMVWTDPPYGVSYVGGTGLTIDNDDLGVDELTEFLRAALGNAFAHCRPGGAWFVAGPGGPASLAFSVVLSELAVWRQTLAWVKDQFVLGRSDYHGRHELLFYGWRLDPSTPPPGVEDLEHLYYGWKPGAAHQATPDRKQDTVWEYPRPRRNAEHPTMKPVGLVERAILNHTDAGAIVLDPFGGSGSTLIACHQAGRRARLVEFSPSYADVICRRFQELTGIRPVAAATGNEHDFLEE
jgi:DNA modification methylase